MKPVLCLHLVRSTTNAKKEQWIASLPLEFLTLKNQFEKALLTDFSIARETCPWARGLLLDCRRDNQCGSALGGLCTAFSSDEVKKWRDFRCRWGVRGRYFEFISARKEGKIGPYFLPIKSIESQYLQGFEYAYGIGPHRTRRGANLLSENCTLMWFTSSVLFYICYENLSITQTKCRASTKVSSMHLLQRSKPPIQTSLNLCRRYRKLQNL